MEERKFEDLGITVSKSSQILWDKIVIDHHAVAREGMERRGHNEFDPMAIFIGSNGMEIPSLMIGPGAGQLREAVVAGYRVMTEMLEKRPDVREHFGPEILGIIVHGDTFTIKTPSLDDPRVPQAPGDLQERFEAGDPEVMECLFTIGMSYKNATTNVSQTYRWTPVDGWEWDEPTSYSNWQSTDHICIGADQCDSHHGWDLYGIAAEAKA